eukprot:s5825_g1.t1
MVSIVDSEAQFDLRLNQVKVPLQLQRALKGAGVTTISSLAYAFGQPGQPIPSDEFSAWVRSLEPGATVGGVATLKRLLFESQTQLLADLKDKILNPEPLVARKVPAAEREARLSNLKLRLNGVIVEGHSEPAHALLDLATQLFDQNVLRYIPLEKCYSRLTELSVSGKPQSKLLEVESSKVVVKDRELDHEATVQSSYQALEALKRRGLALEFAGVMSFTCHDRYVQLLFAHLNRDPPSGYNRCSVSQLLAADKAAWTSLIEKNVKPRPDAAGTLELDSKLEDALKSYEVSFTLLPLATKHQPAVAKPSAASPSGKGNPPAAGKGNRKGSNRFAPYNAKGRNKGKGRFDQRIPKEIREAGGTAPTPDGNPICFDYSLKKCRENVADGARESRKFSTSEETAYPMPLAYHIAYFIAQELVARGWSCDEFVDDAVKAGHPIGAASKLPSALEEALTAIRTMSLSDLAKHRHSTLVHWLGRAKSLAPEEVDLHRNLHNDLQGILAPKRLLLWKEMLSFYGYPHPEVFDEVIDGVELAGAAPFVPAFEPNFKPAAMTTAELASGAEQSRVSLLSTVRSSGDSDMDSEIFNKTLAELDCGWLDGPYEVSDLPKDAVINRRFGIKQQSGEKVKIRLIDDFSASGVNATVQVESANKLHTLDVVAALCLELLRFSTGQQWVGKTVDLSSAYRQLGVSPKSKWLAFIAVYDPPTDGPKVFSMKALPFGASRSVYSFLRVAHSLWWLGCVALKIAWSNFFDDFVTLSRHEESKVVDVAIEQFFKLLGWEVSSGNKDLPFSSVFKALGVEINLDEWTDGRVKFGNTERRITELVEAIDSVLKTKRLTLHEA